MKKIVYLKTGYGYSYAVGIEGEESETEGIYTGFESARAGFINLMNKTDREEQEAPDKGDPDHD